MLASRGACYSQKTCPTTTLRSSTAVHHRRRLQQRVVVLRAAAATEVAAEPPIVLTDKALSHLKKLQAQSDGDQLLVRVGVREGGCSGLSYIMDFEKGTNVSENDTIMKYDDGSLKLVTDPKSLLYLFGMQLDYSDALINGGFKFENPNANKTCGCGKSFGVAGQKEVLSADCNSA